MYYTVYQITNLINGNIYVGMHQTEDLDDGYLGSGTIIRRAIGKYGRANFKKETLFVFDTLEAMKAKEMEIVTEEFVARNDTYNLNIGGTGSWFRANQVHGPKVRSEWQKKLMQNPAYLLQKQEQGRRICRLWKEGGRMRPDNFKGKHHTSDTILRMQASHVGKHDGLLNSQYGTVWVCKLGERPKKVQKTDLHDAIASGWVRGRKLAAIV